MCRHMERKPLSTSQVSPLWQRGDHRQRRDNSREGKPARLLDIGSLVSSATSASARRQWLWKSSPRKTARLLDVRIDVVEAGMAHLAGTNEGNRHHDGRRPSIRLPGNVSRPYHGRKPRGLCSNGGAGALFTTVLVLGDEPQ